MSPRALRLAVGLGTAILFLILGAVTLLLLWRLEGNARGIATDTVERSARAAEATVNRQFLAVDGMLAGLPPLLGALSDAGRLEPNGVGRTLRDLTFQNFNFRNLLLVRPDGTVWAAGLPDSRRRPLPVPAAALAAAADAATVAIIGPVLSQATGEWTLFFARRSVFAGLGPMLAVAEVPVPQIAALLAPAGDEPGLRITVERADGTLLASLPHDEAAIGRAVMRPMPSDGTDGAARMAAARLGDAPAMLAARAALYRGILVTAGWTRDGFAASTGLDRQTQRLLIGMAGAAALILALGFALNLALRQRERGEAERAAARAMLENAIESMSDGFVMFDADDRLVISNSRYRELYALSAHAIHPGATFEAIIRAGAENGQYPQAGTELEAFVVALTAWHRGDHPAIERELPGGRWLLVTERRMSDGGTVGIRTEITDLKRANTEITAARDTAAAATRAKTLFLARMSHELRTPLNGVLGLAQALARDPALTEEARGRAATLEAAGRHLVAVANDLLDLARAEEGRLELHPTAFDPRTVLREAAALIQPAAGEKRVKLVVALAPGLPELVRADATRVRQLLLNLLSNAVKFTPPGGTVTLAARALDGGGPHAMVRLEVRDTGPGVPAAARQAIFGDFVQAADGHARGGAGLGLAIAALIVERMGGRIGCDAAGDGGGALFWAELPLEAVTPAAGRLAPGPSAEPANARALNVLVVDDVPSNLAVARALLGSAGHAVTCAPGGTEALALIADSPPFDVALMDLMMPGMDGLETTRRIRALPGAAARLPILAVTASAFPEDIAACREAGMDGHLAKPIERAALLLALHRLIDNPEPAALPLLEPTRPPAFDIPGLDDAASERLKAAFVSEIALAADALRQAATDDPPGIAAAAHRLAGAGATLGATRLAGAARALEREARRPTDADREALRRAALDAAALTLAELRAAERIAA